MVNISGRNTLLAVAAAVGGSLCCAQYPGNAERVEKNAVHVQAETQSRLRSLLEGGRGGPHDVTNEEFSRGIAAAQNAVFQIRGRLDSKKRTSGTGFLVAPNVIMTNNHVVAGTDYQEVHLDPNMLLPLPFPVTPLPYNIAAIRGPHYEVETAKYDDRQQPVIFSARPVYLSNGERAIIKGLDIALLEIPADMVPRLPGSPKPLQFGTAPVGTRVASLGNPGNFRNYAMVGHMNRVGILDPESEDPAARNVPWVSASPVTVNGNSGGPLIAVVAQQGSDGKRETVPKAVAVSTFAYRFQAGEHFGGGPEMKYVAFRFTEECGIPLMTRAEVEECRRNHPEWSKVGGLPPLRHAKK